MHVARDKGEFHPSLAQSTVRFVLDTSSNHSLPKQAEVEIVFLWSSEAEPDRIGLVLIQ